ncbi:MAG: hypothetical protein C0506_15575 [Anaerolinea sp.]|nr:hypothetical protein [Anaerolinea sp.]
MSRLDPRLLGFVSLVLFGMAGMLFAAWVLRGGMAASAAGTERRAVMPALARDGYLPTPTPIPVPNVARHCYAPRDDSGGFTLRPASATSVFRNCQVVAFYGVPGVPGLGVLGQYPDSAAMLAGLKAQAAAYDEVNGGRRVVGALHLIAAVAQASAGPDGNYLERASNTVIQQLIDFAEQHDLLVILDLQIGWSTVAEEVEAVLPYLANPRVHLALDPEWTMSEGYRPGEVIGSMDAAQINVAQAMLRDLVVAKRLPDKVLIVHQFTPGMITNKAEIAAVEGVDLVIDIDGFGYAAAKVSEYNAFVEGDGMEHGGMKLFYKQDIDLMPPATVSSLVPQPDVVIYQ